ncbi:MAG: acetylornithine deacetylase [Myxococcales bacterium]|nr:acetylornithine deacetylase [Myxococcales bacterium]
MADETLARTLGHLERLVAFDTRNPPRAIDGGGIFSYLQAELSGHGLTCTLVDLGEGCVYLLATRGAPKLLINAHVDTVPADPGWTTDPLRLVVDDERAVGLGACDIKGAVACLLAVLGETQGPVALLFSSDEEAGSSRCVRHFIEQFAFTEVLVAEPTSCKAVLEHRGIGAATLFFTGIGGHASAARALRDSAVHEAVRWASRALDHAAASEEEGEGALKGMRLNLGAIEGGVKANMIASAASIRLGVRPPPELPPPVALERLLAQAQDQSRVRLAPGFSAPPLPACGAAALSAARVAAAELAARLGLPVGPPVDFWTEAALFSAAGSTALVFGPGDIAQAHTAGEYVRLAELVAAAAYYRRVLS